MGAALSTDIPSSATNSSDSPNPDSSSDSPIPADPNHIPSPDPKTLKSIFTAPKTETLNNQPSTQPTDTTNQGEGKTPVPDSDRSEKKKGEDKEDEEEEEEGECGFCLFMKGGECKNSFIDWERCVQEAGDDEDRMHVKCADATGALLKCMKAHPDYYSPIHKAMEPESESDSEKEKTIEVSNTDLIEKPENSGDKSGSEKEKVGV